jgi:hypothetical protein
MVTAPTGPMNDGSIVTAILNTWQLNRQGYI